MFALWAAAPLAHGAVPTTTTAPTNLAYKQVAAIGGFDTGATYGASTTTLDGAESAGRFVDPVGMAVDTTDAAVPGGTAIYVLDLLNPQAIDPVANSVDSPDDLVLDYRIQKLAIAADGSEDVVASTTFGLASSSSTPDERAVALAVDGLEDRVDVLVDDTPDRPGSYEESEEIDQWSTSLTGMAVAVSHATLGTTLDGVSLAFAGTGATAELALGATKYVGGLTSGNTTPVIQRFNATTGANAGPAWNDVADATNQTADDWGEGASGGLAQALYSLSANPDGTLNVSFGPQEITGSFSQTADFEPIMATVDFTTGTTTPVLPSPDTDAGAQEDFANTEIAATDALEQDPADGPNFGASFPAPSGGTQDGGTLAPSVIELSSGDGVPDGLYAGFVADDQLGEDLVETTQGDGNFVSPPPAWSVEPTTGTPDLGIRIFSGSGDDTGVPLGMIGNATQTGSCGLQGGAAGYQDLAFAGSMMALQAGPDGTVYALVQGDLDAAAHDSSGQSPIDPADPLNDSGDQVIEFAPVSSPAAGTACPEPSGGFSVTNESVSGSAPDSGSGPITVAAGTTLSFDASPVDLQGAAPWTYAWDLDNGANAGNVDNSFIVDQDDQFWERSTSTASFVYRTPGTYTVTLNLLNDFGTYTVSRQVIVTAVGTLSAAFTGPTSAVTGQSVSFDASSSTAGGGGNAILEYHWDFGDGTSDDTTSPVENWVFGSPGTRTVTLTETDRTGATSTATMPIDVTQGPLPPITTLPPPTTTSSVGTIDNSGDGGDGSTSGSSGSGAKGSATASAKIRSLKQATQLAVTLSCPAAKPSCAGKITVRTATPVANSKALRTKKKVYTVGTASYSLKSGATQAVSVHLVKETQQLLAVNPLLKLKVSVTGTTSTELHYSLLAPPQKNAGHWFGSNGNPTSASGGTKRRDGSQQTKQGSQTKRK